MRSFSVKAALLAGVFVAASSPVLAADLPAPPPPAPPMEPAPAFVPSYSWTGFYAGLNAGYALTSADSDESFAGWDDADDADGFTGGGQLGYNYQFGSVVVGVEGDFSYFGLEAEDNDYALESNWLSTIRGRVGYAFDRIMIYGTGGVAFSDIKFTEPTTLVENDDVKVGWTVGGGVEGMITPNWTAKLEYLYANFKDDESFGGTEVDLDTHVIRAGLNYKFNW